MKVFKEPAPASTSAPSSAGPRNIRAGWAPQSTKERSYKTLASAAAASFRRMIQEGKVGDKLVIYHAVTGLEIAVLRMTAKGEIRSNVIGLEYLK